MFRRRAGASIRTRNTFRSTPKRFFSFVVAHSLGSTRLSKKGLAKKWWGCAARRLGAWVGCATRTLELEEGLRKQSIRYVKPEDLLAFGMKPEFIGRLPVVSSLDTLTEDEMVAILTETKNAMVKQYTKL